MLTAEQLNDLRKRVLADEHYSLEELAAAIRQQVAERVSAFEAPAKKPKTKSTPVNLDDLI